jgi:isoleucyl-tRNA synthetase
MAPTAPFLSETLYQRLKNVQDAESIHLRDMPQADESLINADLERKMDIAQRIVNLTRMLREKTKLRVRQPLKRILIPVMAPSERRDIQSVEDIILEELNIKKIEFVSEDTENIVRRKAKPNFKTIGKKFGKSTQTVAELIKNLTDSQINEIEKKKTMPITLDGIEYELLPEDIEVYSEDIEGWLVATDSEITVALDTQLDEGLIKEGLAREFVNRIQNLRKNSGYDVTDRINIEYFAPDTLADAVMATEEYIKNETLTESISRSSVQIGIQVDFEEYDIYIQISKIK